MSVVYERKQRSVLGGVGRPHHSQETAWPSATRENISNRAQGNKNTNKTWSSETSYGNTSTFSDGNSPKDINQKNTSARTKDESSSVRELAF